MIEFEWDRRKATANVRKHRIQFADAVQVLEDERAITLQEDVDDEPRSRHDWNGRAGSDSDGRVHMARQYGLNDLGPSGNPKRA